MNYRKNSKLFSGLQPNAGGIVYVPPTLCPRPAYPPANVAAYVKCTGTTWLNKIQGAWLVRQPIENSPVLEVS